MSVSWMALRFFAMAAGRAGGKPRPSTSGPATALHPYCLRLQRLLARVDRSSDPLAHRAERRAEHLSRYAGVGHLELGRLAADVVQRLGALDVAPQLGHLRVSDRVDRDNDGDADQRADDQLSDHLEHRPSAADDDLQHSLANWDSCPTPAKSEAIEYLQDGPTEIRYSIAWTIFFYL